MEEEKKNVESPHSVKISINAKGQYSAEVKCYGTSPEEAIRKATEKAFELETLIKEKNA